MSKAARGKGTKGNAEEKENLVKYLSLLRSAALCAVHLSAGAAGIRAPSV